MHFGRRILDYWNSPPPHIPQLFHAGLPLQFPTLLVAVRCCRLALCATAAWLPRQYWWEEECRTAAAAAAAAAAAKAVGVRRHSGRTAGAWPFSAQRGDGAPGHSNRAPWYDQQPLWPTQYHHHHRHKWHAYHQHPIRLSTRGERGSRAGLRKPIQPCCHPLHLFR